MLSSSCRHSISTPLDERTIPLRLLHSLHLPSEAHLLHHGNYLERWERRTETSLECFATVGEQGKRLIGEGIATIKVVVTVTSAQQANLICDQYLGETSSCMEWLGYDMQVSENMQVLPSAAYTYLFGIRKTSFLQLRVSQFTVHSHFKTGCGGKNGSVVSTNRDHRTGEVKGTFRQPNKVKTYN